MKKKAKRRKRMVWSFRVRTDAERGKVHDRLYGVYENRRPSRAAMEAVLIEAFYQLGQWESVLRSVRDQIISPDTNWPFPDTLKTIERELGIGQEFRIT